MSGSSGTWILLKKICEREHIELIPAIFSVGYGGGALGAQPQLGGGVVCSGCPIHRSWGRSQVLSRKAFAVRQWWLRGVQGQCRLWASRFHDKPGEISFRDETVKHGGKASIRLENFQADPYGHARVMQSIQVQPHRCYRVAFWVKTENLQPANAFRTAVLAGERDLAPREFHVPSTTDWRKVSFIFNSLNLDKVGIYAGLWGGKTGKVWIDDWTVEEIGPVNVLSRPGTPTRVENEDGKVVYEEGKDYAALRDPQLQPYFMMTRRRCR